MAVLFGLCFFLLGAGFMTWKATQLWRDAEQVAFFMSAFTFLPFGTEAKRGEVRAIALTAGSLWSISLLFLSGWVDAQMDSFLSVVGFLVSMIAIVIFLVLETSVVLFNRPKFVVPPHMRTDLGVLATRRTRRTAGPKRLDP